MIGKEPTERAWQLTVVTAAKHLGYMVYHTEVSIRSVKGFPDLVLAGRGQVVFAELKTTRGRVSPEQKEWLGWLRQNGAKAYLWFPADWPEVETVLRNQ